MNSSREIDSVRAQANIVAIVGRYVQLRKEGHEFIGCCPFHEEKTASFKVDAKKNGGVYICFGCGAKGDVFRFIQMIDGLDFKAALARVKELSGMSTSTPSPTLGRRTVKPAESTEPPRAKRGPIVAAYTYLDEKGYALFEVCRHEPGADGRAKDFTQRVPVPGGYEYSVKGVRRVLYRLPHLLTASEVWICEGEKDVHTLEQLGFSSTTNAGGAKAPWLAEYSESLKGKDIIIVPDNDEPGRARGEAIARELAAHAERVTTVILPDACKDVTDFIEAGNSVHDLRVLAEEARAAIPPEAPKSFAPLEKGEKLTPNDIARLIIRDHMIMSNQEGFIYEYNHRVWEQVTSKRIAAYAMAYDTHNETKASRRKEAVDYAVTYTHVTAIKWRQIGLHEVPVWNGVFNLKTGELRAHRKEDYLEAVPATPYLEGRTCPAWLEALRLYWGEDEDYEAKVSALQEFFGYCLMSHALYKKALMVLGESDTGKSQILNVLKAMIGEGNICCIPLEVMDDSRRLPPIMGKMVNVLAEVTSKAQLADGGFKSLVAGDPVTIYPKYEAEITYVPTAKHVIACNGLPRVTDHSRGIYNRLVLLKFNRVIPAEQQNRNFASDIKAEVDGILAWSLDGARRLYERAGEFTRIPESDREVAEYRERENPVNDFIAECCAEVDEGDVNPLLVSDFAAKLSNWAGKNYEARTVISMLRNAGWKVEKCKTRGPFREKRCVFGLELVSK